MNDSYSAVSPVLYLSYGSSYNTLSIIGLNWLWSPAKIIFKPPNGRLWIGSRANIKWRLICHNSNLPIIPNSSMIRYLTPSNFFRILAIYFRLKFFGSRKFEIGNNKRLCSVEPPIPNPALAVGQAIKHFSLKSYFQALIISLLPVPAWP